MNYRNLVAALVALAAIVAPVITYVTVFGTELSREHSRWAEFGSAIGGIYSPLVALLTLAVLVMQVVLQREMNVHAFDQAYLQQAKADIEFYSQRMVEAMNAVTLPGKTLRIVLHENFQPASYEALDSQQLRLLAANIQSAAPSSFDIWAAIYPILMGLDAGKTRMYLMTRTSSMQKLIALLSFETCVALDNFHRARSEGRSRVEYAFSPLLERK